MYCPKCNTNLPDEAEFCSNCGTNLKELTSSPPLTPTTESSSNPSNNNESSNLKNFCLHHKKSLLIGGVSIFLILMGIFLFNNFNDFTKISWDMQNGDAKVTHTETTILTLNVLAYDKYNKNINNIKFSVDDGKIVSNGTTVKWTLPSKPGEYTIIATAPSGKKISKSVKVVELNDPDEKNHNLYGVVANSEDANSNDYDNDGITNEEEKKLGTNPLSADSDADGLPDKFEIDETKTDPLKADTDNDGINDGNEKDLELNPLEADSKGDGIKDGARNLTYTINDENLGVSMQINGQGNIANSTIDILKNNSFSNIDGLIDTIYNFYTSGKLENASVTIKYNLEEITQAGLNENNLTLYYFDEETKKLEAIPTTVDQENKTITVTLNHFSKYVLGDNQIVKTDTSSQIMFIIDNSASMYSEAQMIEAGYKNSKNAVGNDSEFKRLSLTNNMIDTLTGNYEFGIAEFSGNYVSLTEFTSDKSSAKEAVNSMKSKWNSNGSGTNIIDALKEGLAEFNTDENNHYMILLTDGKNTQGSFLLEKKSIINSAKEKKVKVCVIGIGNNIDTDNLNDIAEETGCDYYNAAVSSNLDEIYAILGTDINYKLVDTNNDKQADGMIKADSGFIVTRDGFSFDNFKSNRSANGHCYGMATFAMLYYTNQLPLSLEKAHKSTAFKNFQESGGYDLTNTFISNKKPLYTYKITNEALKLLLNDVPDDYRDRVENQTWMIKEEYYEKLSDIGATFSIKDYPNGDKDFDKYQSALLNIDNETFNKSVVKDESQLLNAIYRLFILQVEDKRTSFSTNPDQAFEELNTELSNGTPVVTIIDNNHAINAIRLIQDINDANKFKIEVYDNNYPGETRYIDVIRTKYSKFAIDFTAWTNKYNYTFTYDANNDGTAEELELSLSYPTVE